MLVDWQNNPRYQKANKLRQRRQDGGMQPFNPLNVTNANAVRAMGSSFDPAYAQNLAVFGTQGGNIQPGGIAFNPTSPSPFEGMGQPIGGGNAPTYGMLSGNLASAQSSNAPYNLTPVGSPYFTPGGVQGLGV